MPSLLTWLDHSEHERRKAIEAIKLFEERGTVDELGIGTVRDAISDTLFPGTSVLQPRARYFLIVPWVYLYLEGKKTPSAEVAAKARRIELDLIERILESDDNARAIGRSARQGLKILPSTMFWGGLGKWGIRRLSGSQENYHRSLDRHYRIKDAVLLTDDSEQVHDHSAAAWHSGIPHPPPGFPKEALPLSLTNEEARYLHERILTHCRGSLLAHLVDRCKPNENVEFPWEHPEAGGFTEQHLAQLTHARNLSTLTWGAAVLYNLLLARKSANEDLVGRYIKQYDDWTREVQEHEEHYASWNRGAFWTTVLAKNLRITTPTRTFVDTWLNHALSDRVTSLPDSPAVGRLFLDRERQLKGRLARLDSEAARKNWGGSSGLSRLDYRWNPQVRQLTTDIQRGLVGNA